MNKENKLVAVYSYRQACCYIAEGYKPKDLEYKNMRLIFYFDKEETAMVFKKWKNKEYYVSSKDRPF